jgi:hypothetical protein
MSESSITPIVLALNLLYLLVENRLADFHCEVSLLKLLCYYSSLTNLYSSSNS